MAAMCLSGLLTSKDLLGGLPSERISHAGLGLWLLMLMFALHHYGRSLGIDAILLARAPARDKRPILDLVA